jgi:hypothetical protein
MRRLPGGGSATAIVRCPGGRVVTSGGEVLVERVPSGRRRREDLLTENKDFPAASGEKR